MSDNKGKSFEFEIVNEADIEFVSRGRKSAVDPRLVAALQKLQPGKFVRLTSMTVNVKSDSVKTEKARIGGQLRSAAGNAGVKIVIRWSSSGVPQVGLRKK